MATKQKITVTGNLTEDPSPSSTKAGKSFVKARIAVNTGQGENKATDYFDVRVWTSDYSPDFPENVFGSLKKGDRVTITGAIEATAWTAQDGSLRSGITIHADDVSASLRYASVAITRNPRETYSPPAYGNQRARGGFVPAAPSPQLDETPTDDPFAADPFVADPFVADPFVADIDQNPF